jgi:NCS1 family nucleobase:cation symporter-1
LQIESRSIDFIPDSERYGTPKRLFSLWISSAASVLTIAIGTLGILGGLGFAWTAVAIICGNAIGTVFMAAHSAQGPHLGIPQMIQSRAQFGVLGAGIPLIVVVVVYIVFVAAQAVMVRGSINAFLPVGNNTAIVIFGVWTCLIAFVGYELIHRIGYYLTVASTVLLVIAAYLTVHHAVGTVSIWPHASNFKSTVFLAVFAQAVSGPLGYAPIVADYSRYLPSTVSVSKTFLYSYLGMLIGSTLTMLLGALLATFSVDPTADPGGAVAQLFGSYRLLAYLIVIVGITQPNVLCVYSAYMSTATVVSGFHGMTHVRHFTKLLIMAAVTAAATVIALSTQYNFDAYFRDILVAQVYVLVPWSSINLVDYYFVRRGKYDIGAIFDVGGRYGRYNFKTIFVYGFSLVVETPFFDLSFYRGPIARAIGGDITWLPALIVPAILYWYVNRAPSGGEGRQGGARSDAVPGGML